MEFDDEKNHDKATDGAASGDTNDSSDSNIVEADDPTKEAIKDAAAKAIESLVRDLAPLDARLPQTLFIVPVQSMIVYPGMMAPLVISKPHLIETVENAMANQGIIGLLLTKPNVDVISQKKSDELYDFGVVVKIVRKLKTSDGAMTLLIQSLKRFKVSHFVRQEPFLIAQVEYKEDVLKKDAELEAFSRAVISQVKSLSDYNPFFTEEIKLAMLNASSPGALADLIAFALSLRGEEAQDFLETIQVKQRFEKLLIFLKKEQELTDIQKKITEDVNNKIQTMQREYFLKEQLRSIRKELGGADSTGSLSESYQKKVEALSLPEDSLKIVREELNRLETISESSPEYNVIRNYLDLVVALPWNVKTEDNLDLKRAQKILDEDHFGLEKIKKRILESLAVRKLNPQAKGSILCFVGPPGVGKTSLGKSVARALGRKFFRISLGGMRDEAEIKGHRKTYIGAMPGKLISALKRAGSKNPVIVLDEIDKLGMSYQGDPASALLEVLDPEQNQTFTDHYLDLPFDLSDVLFIVTANQTDTILEPLLDRMEVIQLSGYTFEEKEKITSEHILPRELERHGLKPDQLSLDSGVIQSVMEKYSREPGMRTAQQQIATICRKVAAKIVQNKNLKKVIVKKKDLHEYLGPTRFDDELFRKKMNPGEIVGLAWTSMGGQILFIESVDIPKQIEWSSRKKPTTEAGTSSEDRNFGSLKITGQLGDVMNESAQIAFSYVKKKTKGSKRAQDFFKSNDIHLHIPAGAIPKDGPSAGVTMATSLYSLVTGRSTKPFLAMTGELSLVGRVLPVGGIREKVLAARRMKIKTIILPRQNKKDLEEIPSQLLRDLTFHFVDKVDDVFRLALLPA